MAESELSHIPPILKKMKKLLQFPLYYFLARLEDLVCLLDYTLWKLKLSKISLIRLIGCTVKSFGSLVTHLRAGGAREIRGFSFDN